MIALTWGFGCLLRHPQAPGALVDERSTKRICEDDIVCRPIAPDETVGFGQIRHVHTDRVSLIDHFVKCWIHKPLQSMVNHQLSNEGGAVEQMDLSLQGRTGDISQHR